MPKIQHCKNHIPVRGILPFPLYASWNAPSGWTSCYWSSRTPEPCICVVSWASITRTLLNAQDRIVFPISNSRILKRLVRKHWSSNVYYWSSIDKKPAAGHLFGVSGEKRFLKIIIRVGERVWVSICLALSVPLQFRNCPTKFPLNILWGSSQF